MTVRRNLLIILSRGLRSDVLADGQAWPVTTPNLDSLAARGLRLEGHSACPADDGGRISLLTGLHARQHGHVESCRGSVCDGWPALLAAQGYQVAGVGCVGALRHHLAEAVVVADVQEIDSPDCAYLRAMAERHQLKAIQLQRRQRERYGPFQPDRLLLEPDDDIDGFIAVEALRTLADLGTERPRALIVVFNGPGNDLPPPGMYDQVVDPGLLEAGFVPVDLTRLDALAELDYPRVLLQRLDPIAVSRIRADYLGRVSLIDHGVGRLLAQLRDRADNDRTWVVAASDRGQLLGEHGLMGHRSFLAGSIKVPIILAPPSPVDRRKGGRGVRGISTVDAAATIAILGGCDLPDAVAGRSLLPLLGGDGAPVFESSGPDGLCLSEFGQRLMLETDRYKVVFSTSTRRAIGLYDLLNDGNECENLIPTSAGRNVLDALRWRLAEALLPLRSPSA